MFCCFASIEVKKKYKLYVKEGQTLKQGHLLTDNLDSFILNENENELNRTYLAWVPKAIYKTIGFKLWLVSIDELKQ